LAHDRQRTLVGVGAAAPHFLVDLARGLLAVVAAAHQLGAEEVGALALGVVDRADGFAHAELGDHRARHLGRALDVVEGAGGDVAAELLLGGAAAEGQRELADQAALLHVVALLVRQDPSHAERAPARHTTVWPASW
jgi:hypothetical protein